MAVAAASAPQDVAVREESETTLAPVDVTPTTVVPATRRARRRGASEAWRAAAQAASAPAAEPVPEKAPEPSTAAAPEAEATPAESAPITETIVVEPAASHPFARWFAASSDAAPEQLEPEAPAAEQAPADETGKDESCDAADPFLEAVRAFGTTGETPIVAQSAPRATSEHVAQGRATRPGRTRRIATTAVASVGVMGIVGMLAIGLTTPVGAVAAPADSVNPAAAATTAIAPLPRAADDQDIQAFVAPVDVAGEALEVTAEFESQTFAEIAAAEGINISNAAFTNDPTADIQWPFSVGVGISSYYGMRWGRLHAGIDFVPGNGAPIQAIADGTVRVATESGGAYGVNVYIDHVIDGQLVTSHYAHMQYGSLRVSPGQQVKVGDIIGLTGNTGRSYGAHLHFEIIVGGSTIDPLPWLEKWANTHFPDEQLAADVDDAVEVGSPAGGD